MILLFFDKIFFLSLLSLPFGLMHLEFRIKMLCVFCICALRVTCCTHAVSWFWMINWLMAMMMMVVVIISCFTFVVSVYKNLCVLVSAVFFGTFLSAGIDTFICIHVTSFFVFNDDDGDDDNNNNNFFLSWRDSSLVGLGLLLIHVNFCDF